MIDLSAARSHPASKRRGCSLSGCTCRPRTSGRWRHWGSPCRRSTCKGANDRKVRSGERRMECIPDSSSARSHTPADHDPRPACSCTTHSEHTFGEPGHFLPGWEEGCRKDSAAGLASRSRGTAAHAGSRRHAALIPSPPVALPVGPVYAAHPKDRWCRWGGGPTSTRSCRTFWRSSSRRSAGRPASRCLDLHSTASWGCNRCRRLPLGRTAACRLHGGAQGERGS